MTLKTHCTPAKAFSTAAAATPFSIYPIFWKAKSKVTSSLKRTLLPAG